MLDNRPKVGIGVLVLNQKGEALLLRRQNAHGSGLWGGTGGHLEHLESFAECAKRESREEAGIEINNIRFLCVTNFQDYAPKHYIDIGLVANYVSGEPRIMEPEKCDKLGWFSLDELPHPLFGPLPNYVRAYRGEKQYFDV
jgi:8-oxo-dGTP diphosphatase